MFHELFGKQPIIVSLDIDSHIEQTIAQLYQSGLQAIELLKSNRVLLAKLKQKFPNIKIGLGNILNVTELTAAYEDGFDFMSSPGFYAPLVQTANIYQISYLPGISNMSDAINALSLQIHHARPCPGNLELCNLLNKYTPQIKLYPMDVAWGEIEQLLDLPSVAAVGLSNPDQLQLIQITESIQV